MFSAQTVSSPHLMELDDNDDDRSTIISWQWPEEDVGSDDIEALGKSLLDKPRLKCVVSIERYRSRKLFFVTLPDGFYP